MAFGTCLTLVDAGVLESGMQSIPRGFGVLGRHFGFLGICVSHASSSDCDEHAANIGALIITHPIFGGSLV